jgi:hypothetical protein
MVTYAQLRDARPDLWQTAADDLLAAAKQSERTAENIHANGIRPLEDSWADATGNLARGTLVTVANRMVNAGVLARGATSALDALQDALSIAQRQLHSAVADAQVHGFVVGENGRLDFAPGTLVDAMTIISMMNLQRLIDDAVEAATQADEACVTAFTAVDVDPDSVTLDDARERQSTAVHQALLEMRNLLPDGLGPLQVEQWWRSLTPQQQHDLMRAVPVELADLDGIPESVKQQLGDDGRGYSPLAAVRWALGNYANEDIDIFGNNCANFASHALLEAGLGEKGWNTLQDDAWGRSLAGDWHIPWISGKSHTETWYNSDLQRQFFLDNGGSQIQPQDARPGDIVYFNYADGEGGNPDGVSHHTAVVTAVLPDGEILYTQHTPGAANQSLQDRLPVGEQHEGRQGISIVRPKETW